jgi:DNA-binding transcriptional LysR family regulator
MAMKQSTKEASRFAGQSYAPHGIDIRHIRYVLLAADLRSFAKAAAFAGIKNATLSRHISYLEQKFGAVLFVRSTRGVVPTEAGQVFLESAKRVLDEIDGLYEKTRAVGRGAAGAIGIGFITSITAGNLRSSLFAFQDEYPHIEMRGVEEERHRLLVKLDTGNLDLLIISGSASHADTVSLGLWSERMFVALPNDHPLAARDKVYWSDLNGETFFAPKTTADDIQTMVKTRLAQPGNDPVVVVTDVSRETVLGAVGGGRAISIVSAGSSGMKIDNVTFRPLFDTNGPHVLNFSAYWRSDNRNPALQTFLSFLRARYSLAPLLD